MAKKSDNEINMEAIENQKIVNVELNNEMRQSYIEYAMSVIVSRALPDVRDGLKPVHRRILYDMYESNLLYENDFRKSAATVGDVLAKYHPHGDSSVYDAMVRMAQDWSLRYPLVFGKGNFGSIDGDPPAAYRYTEAKMSKLSALMLEDIEKDTVKFIPNYDDKKLEPDVLPSRFPQLLVNGSSGIAVGMATNIPPHNLGEVVDGIIAVIDDPDITIEELMHYIKGPDFPTAGIILGQSGIRSAYTTGRGRIIMRARTEIEEHANHNRIIITELPYQVNKARLHERIAELVKDGKVDGISALRDESDKDGIRFVIELKRDANANVVLNNLFKYTQMQETFGAIMIALVGKDKKEPKVLNLREILDYYIAHQEEVIERRTRFELKKAEEHAHLLEGYRIAIDNIHEIVETIRKSSDNAESKKNLMDKFSLTEVQASAIVAMSLGRLNGLESSKIDEDYRKTTENIEDYKDILAHESRVHDIIKTDLLEIKAKYGDERRSEISFDVNDIDIEDLIDEEEIIVTLTHMGYVKRMPVTTYRSQRRGGRGVSGVTTKEEDFVEQLLTTSTHDNILFFTTKGVVYKLKGYQLPDASRQAKGSAIVNLLPLEQDEKISAAIAVKDFEEGRYLTFVTKKGMIKKTDLMDYSKIRAGGLRAIELNENDELIKVSITEDNKDIIVGTHEGLAIRFNESEVRPTGRITRGVRAIRLNENDYVVGASIAEENTSLLVVTENGYGKRTSLDEYRLQSRGGKGVFTYKITNKTGCIAGMDTVTDDKDVMMITSEGVVIRLSAADISTFGRQTQGVKLMRLDDDVRVVSIALSEKEAESEENNELADSTEKTENTGNTDNLPENN